MQRKQTTTRKRTIDPFRLSLRAVIYQEGEFWLAHCLELDIVGEGASPAGAMATLISLCEIQVETAMESGDIESIFRPAPPEFWKMFTQGKDAQSPKARGPLERFEVREVAFAG